MGLFSCSYTPIIKSSDTPKRAMASLEFVVFGGVKQCLLIRSNDTNNPVILYLHGGPGVSEMPFVRKYNEELEKHFTVVYWEQRGGGKSLHSLSLDGSYTMDQYVNDGHELTNYLLHRFKKEKLIVIGHSWGTIVGTELITRYPALYSAYVGIGQVVNPQKGEALSYQFVLGKAMETGNRKAITELKQIDSPFYLTVENNKNWYSQLMTERKWLTRFGGVFYNQHNYRQVTKTYLHATEYSLVDFAKFGIGSVLSIKKLWPEIMQVNFLKNRTNFKLPVYYVQGKYDYNCPSELVYEYFHQISAPHKELIIFDQSAHLPNFEESKRFNQKMIDLFAEGKK